MKYRLITLFIFSLLSCSSISKITDPQSSNASFCYGSFNFGHDKSKLEVVAIRPVGQIFGLAIAPKYAGDNEFFIDSFKPGKYYIEYVIVDDMKIHFKFFGDESPWQFEVIPNSITNMGSFEIAQTESGILMGKAKIIRSNKNVEKQVLQDLIGKSKDTYWENRLNKFLIENF